MADMELFHVLNRGVDKRIIFQNDSDRARFVHNLFEFNDVAPAPNVYRATWSSSSDEPTFDLHASHFRRKAGDRECLVDLHGWCIMGNHYHLLLSERAEGGVTKFITKINVGYAKYFNKKYERTGTLFESRTKKVLIASDAHFLHILHYIHLNPLDFLKGAGEWRSEGITDSRKALAHLEKYRWSSYLDYCGTKNLPSLITKELFGDVFKNYKKTISSYLKDMEMESIHDFVLE